MKINLSFLKKNKVFKKETPAINPNFYWQIIVYIALCVIFGAFAFGFFLFKDVSKEPVLEDSNVEKKTEKVKRDRIEEALEYFEERLEKSRAIIISPAPVADPSVIFQPEALPVEKIIDQQ